MLNGISERAALLGNRASFLMAGLGIAAWAPMIPFVKERFALDEHTLGLLLLCVGAGAFSFMPVCSVIAYRLGCRLACRLAALGLGAMLCAVAVIDNVYLMAAALFVMGCFSVTLDVVSNINAAQLEIDIDRPIMSGMHGLYSVGGFIGSLSFTFLLSHGLSLISSALIMVAVLVLSAVFPFRGLYGSMKAAEENRESSEDRRRGKAALFHPTVLLIGVLCFIMFMTEGSILDWSGVFLNENRHLDISMAGYGYSAFAITMTFFRLTGDRIVRTFGRRAVLVSGTVFVALGYGLTVSVPTVWAALLGFALIGVGASNVVPQLVSVAAAIKEVPVHVSVSVVNAVGFTGSLIGPALIGFIAHQITLPYTFILQAIAVLCVGAICFRLLKGRR